jgi:hypothetical protein
MSGYRKRPDRILEPGPVLGELRKCRDLMTSTCPTVKPSGVVYHALCIVIVAIDGLATGLTGQQQVQKRAKEQGEI